LQEKEKHERKVAKEEKERKAQQANDKAKSMMVNFFGKTKAPTVTPILQAGPSTPSSSRKSPAAPVAPRELDEFARSFRPFVVKKETELAPVNHFISRHAKGKAREVIEIGDSQDNVIFVDDDDRMDVCSESPAIKNVPTSPTKLASQSSQG
jgi:chromatin assembly factor 1 subunit A